MNSHLSRDAVVDQLTSQLAERRRTNLRRREAYLALARAILSDESQDSDGQPTSIVEAARAA